MTNAATGRLEPDWPPRALGPVLLWRHRNRQRQRRSRPQMNRHGRTFVTWVGRTSSQVSFLRWRPGPGATAHRRAPTEGAQNLLCSALCADGRTLMCQIACLSASCFSACHQASMTAGSFNCIPSFIYACPRLSTARRGSNRGTCRCARDLPHTRVPIKGASPAYLGMK